MNGPVVVDLYSGCGGFGLGAELAGFASMVAVDINEILQSAYRLNFPNTSAISEDISKLDGSAWKELMNGVRPDGVIGGPPCQGFSRIGKRDRDDPRNSLIGHFYRTVSLLDPKFFIMENVEGILDEGNIDALMSAIEMVKPRFHVLPPKVVTASHYGAATSRRRVIVVGYNPNDVDAISFSDLEPPKELGGNTVRDAISDLPIPFFSTRNKDDFAWSKYPSLTGHALSEYARLARQLPPAGLGWGMAVEKLLHQESSGHDITVHSAAVSERYGSLMPGETDPVSKSKKLEWGGVCPTLRAGTGPERGSHQAVRPIHPNEGRVITVREAARMQGFPDWFTFHPTKWTSFRMIGNSVSPKVSQFLLQRIGLHFQLQKAA